MRYSIIFASLAFAALAAPVSQSKQARSDPEIIDQTLSIEVSLHDDTAMSKRVAHAEPTVFNDGKLPANQKPKKPKKPRFAEPTVFNDGKLPANQKPKKPKKPRFAEPTNVNNDHRRSSAARQEVEVVEEEIDASETGF